jgi:hypothetical protein
LGKLQVSLVAAAAEWRPAYFFGVLNMHKRSHDKLLERRIRALIFNSAFVDTRRAETVCMLSRVDVLSMLNGVVDVGLVPPVMRGEVLVDSRGTGSFQR